MLINTGDKLLTKELIKQLGISQNTWLSQKERILNEMLEFYSFHSEPGPRNSTIYFFDKVYDVNNQYTYKRARKTQAFQNRVKLYKLINKECLANSLQSGTSLAHRLKDSFDYKLSTLSVYCGASLNDMYGTWTKDGGAKPGPKGCIAGKVWSGRDDNYNYFGMTEEQRQYLLEPFYIFFSDKRHIEEIAEKYFSDDEMELQAQLQQMDNRLKGIAQDAKFRFLAKYHFYPVCVRSFQVNAFCYFEEGKSYKEELLAAFKEGEK